MPHPLSTEQRTLLHTVLQARQNELDRRFTTHTDGGRRAEHAHEVLQQDGDDAPQRDTDREVDLALTESRPAGTRRGELGIAARARRRALRPVCRLRPGHRLRAIAARTVGVALRGLRGAA